MTMVKNSVILGGVIGLAAIGGLVWTNHRENNSVCSDLFYMDLVHEETRKAIIEDSRYLRALEEGVTSELVSAADQAVYAGAAAALREAVDTTDIVGKMKHPSSSVRMNCHLSLTFSIDDVLDGFDLPKDSFLGFPVNRRFEMVTRFEIRFEDIDGVSLAKNIQKQRNQFLVDSFAVGDVVETATIAKLTRREFTLEEPPFPAINYDTSLVLEEAQDARWIGR